MNIPGARMESGTKATEHGDRRQFCGMYGSVKEGTTFFWSLESGRWKKKPRKTDVFDTL